MLEMDTVLLGALPLPDVVMQKACPWEPLGLPGSTRRSPELESWLGKLSAAQSSVECRWQLWQKPAGASQRPLLGCWTRWRISI